MKKFRKFVSIALSACMLFSGFTFVSAEKAMISPAIKAHAEEAPSPVNYKNIPEGTYNLVNVGSGYYMNYTWGVSKPNPIRIYESDNSSEQKFTLKYAQNGKYLLKINHSDGGYVNCECPTESTIKVGIKLTGRTICEDNTQRFWITSVSNNEYILSNGYNKNLVIGADSSKEGAGLSIQDYQESNALQRWKLIPLDVPAETTEPTTEKSTEPTTEKPTEPTTEKPTEPTTEKPTEPTTEKPTEPTTEKPTEPTTEKPTEPTTEKPTEPTTEKPTELPTDATEPEEKLTVEKTVLSLEVGEQYSIIASQKNLIYQSSEPDVAIVSKKGVITALKEGYAIITVMNFDYDAIPIRVTVKASSSPTFIAGDADSSGEVDILDVITVNKAVLGKENLTDAQLKAIDFNNNGKPDSAESMTILKFIVGLIQEL